MSSVNSQMRSRHDKKNSYAGSNVHGNEQNSKNMNMNMNMNMNRNMNMNMNMNMNTRNV